MRYARCSKDQKVRKVYIRDEENLRGFCDMEGVIEYGTLHREHIFASWDQGPFFFVTDRESLEDEM